MRLHTIFLIVIIGFMSLSLSCATTSDKGTGNENGNHAPSMPYNPYPEHLSTGQSKTPVFSWSCYDQDGDDLTFELELWQGDTEIYRSAALPDTSLYYTETLDDNTEYKWRVTASDGIDEDVQGSFWIFTTGTTTNNPPFPPYNLHPYGSVHPDSVSIEWECYDPDGDALSYDVWLSEILTPLVLIGDDVMENSLDVDGLSDATRYIFQIEAFDPHGGQSISHVSDFYTDTGSPPNPPSAPDPADDETDVPVDVNLAWTCTHPDGLPMTFDVFLGPAGETLPAVSTGQTLSNFTPPTLQYNTEYEWRVVAEDSRGHRTEGPLWSFTTELEELHHGIYAQLILGRSQTYSEFDQTLTRNDWISARFDSTFAPDGPIIPLRASSVICEPPTGFDIPWNEGLDMHFYNDIVNGYFLTPGTEYTYRVKEGLGVPSLTKSITMPTCAPYITSPEAFAFVPRTGFELQWTDYCGGTIAITIFDLNAPGPNDSTGIYIVTEDDGAYTITEKDLEPLDPFAYQIQVVLIVENRQGIVAPTYDSRSFISARILATQILMLNQ